MDWTDTEDIPVYIFIFILWFSRKRRNFLQQNRTEQKQFKHKNGLSHRLFFFFKLTEQLVILTTINYIKKKCHNYTNKRPKI
jgi:hypothetical protein